jgi:chromosome segregation ATPase
MSNDMGTYRQQIENAALAVSEANIDIEAALADLDNLEERVSYLLDDLNAALNARQNAAIQFHAAMKPLTSDAKQLSAAMPKPPAFSKSRQHRTAETSATIKRLHSQLKMLG